MSKRYYWLKLQHDFFDSLRIKKLRKMAGGDTYVIIYLKMQLKAMNTGGVLTYTGLESDFAEELALDIAEEPDNVKVTLAYLLSCGLAESSDNVNFFLPYAADNTGSETASTQRSRDCRAKKALQCNTNATKVQRECNVDKEKIKEESIDKEGTNLTAKNHFSTEFLTGSQQSFQHKDIDKLKEDALERLRQYKEGSYA